MKNLYQFHVVIIIQFVLTKNENIYVWGYNNYGQLGIGDNNNRNIPTLLNLPNNEKPLSISCGDNHTICINKK